MPSQYQTPGVYIQELNAFPNSVVTVETAVPVFIGYTEKAEYNNLSLLNKPVKIASFTEYIERFGGGFKSQFDVVKVDTTGSDPDSLTLGNEKFEVVNRGIIPLFYNSIRLFYANGGGPCYICSVGTYAGKTLVNFKLEDLISDEVFSSLEKELEPTLVVIPDIIALGASAYLAYTKVLAHCQKMQNRFAIFDIARKATDTAKSPPDEFRQLIGVNYLNYAAAYYPWLKTIIVEPDEVDADNLVVAGGLENLLPEPKAKELVAAYNKQPEKEHTNTVKQTLSANLKNISPTYTKLLELVLAKLNELPPSGAIAGIYTMVDNERGVWKAPANVSVNMVTAPVIDITDEQQAPLNIDEAAGKSINVIRSFPNIGTLVWGARTLEGNSQYWRYINVRRTMIMIEQSIKLATQSYVFEPNTANTWITVKSMLENFLTSLWKQGALAGAKPEDAFNVMVGLGTNMTPQDILDGYMTVTVLVAISHPAEFIEITFQQLMPKS